MNINSLVISAVALVFVCSGCSTISGSGTSQPISVQTIVGDGSELEGARCDMTNDEGTWFVVTPGSTTVRRSNKDLQVICKKQGVDLGSANVVSRTKGNMWGNIILGGGIGAIVDHNNGSAYEYPSLIKIFMGRPNQRIEDVTPQSAQNQPPTALVDSKSQDDSFVLAKKKCSDIGLIPGSESFGNCVVKFSN